MSVLIISRQFGAGGKTLGERLARKLGYTLVDRDIIDWVADEAQLSTEWLESVEAESPGRLTQVLSRMVAGDFIQRHLAEPVYDFDPEQYVVFTRKIIGDAAAAGNVVFLGRGAYEIVPDGEGVFKVLLVASRQARLDFLQKQYDITGEQASTLIDKEEREKEAFLSKLSAGRPLDPARYQLCLNTGSVGLGKAEDLILRLMY